VTSLFLDLSHLLPVLSTYKSHVSLIAFPFLRALCCVLLLPTTTLTTLLFRLSCPLHLPPSHRPTGKGSHMLSKTASRAIEQSPAVTLAAFAARYAYVSYLPYFSQFIRLCRSAMNDASARLILVVHVFV
jgi:hypothetical protein